VIRAIDEGIVHFDTAEGYGAGRSEEMLGAAIRAHRGEVVIGTKFGSPNTPSLGAPGGRRNILRACEASLRRLGTDYIDLYYLHRPDPTTPVEETLGVMTELVTAGKVRYLGSSAMPGWQVADADHLANIRQTYRFIAAQIEWNLLKRDVEAEMVPACRRFGVGVIPYFPLASGLLTGKYSRGQAYPDGSRFAVLPRLAGVATDANFDRVERLIKVAAEGGRTILELAICWLLAQPGVASVLTGATSPDQVSLNVAAAMRALDTAELDAVESALRDGP
jgi:aryl-alcohol dehydrogenase-like predicted oxidoreductase